ncbi:MAG: 4Fe-4S binding protein [Sulfuricurvum sp.]|uniref:4Fe-4S binding protein n=1 Tax=Sulfuricurvum sp. TaxID=2025608 RepID=UPI0026045399|nr:4Fe-4S dicluster domain-containing protein [Sulfuricurvum sp.]MDD2828099.1 4Fe-4S binding protein [Sulfuricurvum sp.]MDD4948027.1 4Fe-4S binding protein [Sulfuricurvum sp.]
MKFLHQNRAFLALLIPFMAIPWIILGDFHLLLFNFSHNRLEMGGFGIEMGTYSLIALLLLLGIGIALISTLTLSRFYCGTLCPNTFFAHLLTLFSRKKKSILSKIGGFTLLTALASMLAFSVVAYGISTNELIDAIAHLTFAGWLVILLSLLMIAEVYMVQGWYCAYLCPYGAMCAILPIEDRLTYRFDDPSSECTECEGCVKICPIPSLDIRQGFDIRCIQCGLCEVACEKTFAKNPNITTLISHDQRSSLRAGGRGKGFMIALIAITLFMFAGVIFLSNSNRLDSCRLENQHLHTNSFKGNQ